MKIEINKTDKMNTVTILETERRDLLRKHKKMRNRIKKHKNVKHLKIKTGNSSSLFFLFFQRVCVSIFFIVQVLSLKFVPLSARQTQNTAFLPSKQHSGTLFVWGGLSKATSLCLPLGVRTCLLRRVLKMMPPFQFMCLKSHFEC